MSVIDDICDGKAVSIRDEILFAIAWLQKDARRVEAAHGFGNQTPGEDIALMHSELSEALEDIRNGKALSATYYEAGKVSKPCGVPSELADVVIRILGFCERNGIDLGKAILEKMAYNETRSFKHGGKVL
jgi:NTP pyrophosphatase (non-canonical NTP hydrolase)